QHLDDALASEPRSSEDSLALAGLDAVERPGIQRRDHGWKGPIAKAVPQLVEGRRPAHREQPLAIKASNPSRRAPAVELDVSLLQCAPDDIAGRFAEYPAG